MCMRDEPVAEQAVPHRPPEHFNEDTIPGSSIAIDADLNPVAAREVYELQACEVTALVLGGGAEAWPVNRGCLRQPALGNPA